MALKVKVPLQEKPKTGIDYGSHLSQSKTKPVKGMVTTTKSVAGKTVAGGVSETQTLHPGVITNGMQITVSGGRTLNLGNYESARIDVGITIPCDQDTLNDAYEYGTQWVSEKIEEAIKMAKGE